MAKASLGLRWIWCIVAVWAVVLAIGTSLWAPAPNTTSIVASTDWRRGAVVLVLVGGFLGLWVLLLAKRSSRGFRDGTSIASHRSKSVQASEQHDNH